MSLYILSAFLDPLGARSIGFETGPYLGARWLPFTPPFTDIAKREGIHRATVNDLLRLALLAPDIAQAALEGTLPRTLSLEGLLRGTFPLDWGLQREVIAGMG
jgi:hypothetical protein